MGMSVDLMESVLRQFLNKHNKGQAHEVLTFSREDRIDFIDPENEALGISKSDGLVRPAFLVH